MPLNLRLSVAEVLLTPHPFSSDSNPNGEPDSRSLSCNLKPAGDLAMLLAERILEVASYEGATQILGFRV